MRLDFEQLVRDHYEPLYRFALSLTRGSSEAGDLTQQTFMQWAERGHQLRDTSRAKAWLFTTLYREFLQGRRRADRFPQVELTDEGVTAQALQAQQLRQLEGREVMEALQRVDEPFRAPLSLFYVGEQSYAAIAEMLEIPVGTVMSRLARGKQQLRALMLGTAAENRQRESRTPRRTETHE